MNGIAKYKHENRLWLLQEKVRKETGDSNWRIDSVNGKKVVSLCYSCHGQVYSGSNYYKYATDNIGGYIVICSDCYAS